MCIQDQTESMELPTELWIKVFSFVPREHLGRAKAVGPSFSQIIDDFLPHICDQCTNDDTCLCPYKRCLKTQDVPLCPALGCFVPAKNNHMICFKWAYELGFMRNRHLYLMLAYKGNLDGLKRIHKEDGASPQWDAWACAYAADQGHIQTLVWLRRNGCPIDKWALIRASANGHVRTVEWLLENEDKDLLDRAACEWAAYYDHLDVLQLLRTYKCPWNGSVVIVARFKGHDRIVKWAQANGCPRDTDPSHGYLSWSSVTSMNN